MLGAVLGQLATTAKERSSRAERVRAMKTLISAELVNVAAGYIGLHDTLRAAQASLSTSGAGGGASRLVA